MVTAAHKPHDGDVFRALSCERRDVGTCNVEHSSTRKGTLRGRGYILPSTRNYTPTMQRPATTRRDRPGTRLCTCWTVCSAGNMRIAGHSECVAVASRTGPVFPDRGYRLTLLSLSSRGSAWEMSDCLTMRYRVSARLGVATAVVSLCRDP